MAFNSREYAREYYSKNRERILAQHAQWRSRNVEKCKAIYQDYGKRNRAKISERKRIWDAIKGTEPNRRIRWLFSGARCRARNRRMDFEESVVELISSSAPEKCACCGCLLDYSKFTGRNQRQIRRSSAPSLDRIDNSKGYVSENIAVICMRCNSVKGDGSLTELQLIVDYIRRSIK